MSDPTISSIRIKTNPKRRRRREGDIKMIKGVEHVCRRVYLPRERAYLADSRGRLRLEWVPNTRGDPERSE